VWERGGREKETAKTARGQPRGEKLWHTWKDGATSLHRNAELAIGKRLHHRKVAERKNSSDGDGKRKNHTGPKERWYVRDMLQGHLLLDPNLAPVGGTVLFARGGNRGVTKKAAGEKKKKGRRTALGRMGFDWLGVFNSWGGRNAKRGGGARLQGHMERSGRGGPATREEGTGGDEKWLGENTGYTEVLAQFERQK